MANQTIEGKVDQIVTKVIDPRVDELDIIGGIRSTFDITVGHPLSMNLHGGSHNQYRIIPEGKSDISLEMALGNNNKYMIYFSPTYPGNIHVMVFGGRDNDYIFWSNQPSRNAPGPNEMLPATISVIERQTRNSRFILIEDRGILNAGYRGTPANFSSYTSIRDVPMRA